MTLPVPPDSSSLPESIRLLQLVWKLEAALARTSLDMEAKMGVTGVQRFYLRLIGLAPGISRETLADATGVETAEVQVDLDRLVAASLLVEHGGSPGLYLSAKGATVNAVMTGTIEDAMSKASDEASPFERTSFRRMLERVLEHLGRPLPAR